MNRRSFLKNLGAALLVVPFLPASIKTVATKWTQVGLLRYQIKVQDDGTVSFETLGDIVWKTVPADGSVSEAME